MTLPRLFVRLNMFLVTTVASVYSPAFVCADAHEPPWHILLVPAITQARVLPHEVPAHALAESTIKLTACPREYESASFVIHARKPLSDIHVSASDLRSDAGAIPACALDIRVVKVWYQSGDWLYVRGEHILTPELLLKDDGLVWMDTDTKRNVLKMDKDAMLDADTLQPFDVPANTVKQCWITVQVPAGAKTGTYRGTIAVQPESEDPIDIPIELRVLPFELDEPNMICSIYYRAQFRTEVPKCTSERKMDEQMLAELRDMVAHGVTNPMTYVGTPQNPDGGYDFTDMKRLFKLRKQAGMKGGPLLTQNVSIASPPELIKAMIELARKNGFTEVYFSAADEAKGETLRSQRAAMRRVHELGGKVYAASYQHDSFQLVGDLMDMPVLAGPIALDGTLLAAFRRGGGAKVMSYAYPQGGIEDPTLYRRNYGFILWKGGYGGTCTYTYQHSFGHAWDDYDGGYWRDHNMTYPTLNGVIPTVQWEGYREGYDDLRYMATLENLIEKNWRLDGPAGEAARIVREWLLQLNPTDPHTTLDMVRLTLIDQILAIDRLKDHEYFAARLEERGHERVPVVGLGHLQKDADPKSGAALFEPQRLVLDVPSASTVLDLGAVTRIDVIQLHTTRLDGNNVNLNGTAVELYCSDDNASYRKIPFTYRDVDMRVVELCDIGVEARYFKVHAAYGPHYDASSIRHRVISDATPDGLVSRQKTIRHDPNGSVQAENPRFYLGKEHGGALAFVKKN